MILSDAGLHYAFLTWHQVVNVLCISKQVCPAWYLTKTDSLNMYFIPYKQFPVLGMYGLFHFSVPGNVEMGHI